MRPVAQSIPCPECVGKKHRNRFVECKTCEGAGSVLHVGTDRGRARYVPDPGVKATARNRRGSLHTD